MAKPNFTPIKKKSWTSTPIKKKSWDNKPPVSKVWVEKPIEKKAMIDTSIKKKVSPIKPPKLPKVDLSGVKKGFTVDGDENLKEY
jgi:hypothetical protein